MMNIIYNSTNGLYDQNQSALCGMPCKFILVAVMRNIQNIKRLFFMSFWTKIFLMAKNTYLNAFMFRV